jgi:PAN domain
MAKRPPLSARVDAKPFDPVRWSIAIVILLVFAAVASRVYSSCEASSFELLSQLKVSLGGCPKPQDPGPSGQYVNRFMGVLEVRTNRQGSDYSPISIHAATADECSSKCDQLAWCKAMTFVSNPGNPFGGGDCWLKTAVPPPTADPYMASAIKKQQ